MLAILFVTSWNALLSLYTIYYPDILNQIISFVEYCYKFSKS